MGLLIVQLSALLAEERDIKCVLHTHGRLPLGGRNAEKANWPPGETCAPVLC